MSVAEHWEGVVSKCKQTVLSVVDISLFSHSAPHFEHSRLIPLQSHVPDGHPNVPWG